MKKVLLLTAISSLFFATSAFAHCGSCGAGDEAHDHAKKECCGTEGKCCHEKKACEEKKACGEECKKECCAKKEKCEKTAAAAEKKACCPAKNA
ncbi:MAG: hypothetical protein AB3N33_07470 [Puniceicoccaceae bacterium]